MPNRPKTFWGLFLLLGLLFCTLNLSAQISIGGNVYGGGNEGEVNGNTTVTLRDGTISKVFGGGRMANVNGRAFVNIDGEHASATSKIMIGSVYGGNDISGTVGVNVNLNDTGKDQVPAELTDVLRGAETLTDHPEKNDINNSWSSFVRSSKMTGEESFDHSILVGSVYGGGNGDYAYDSEDDVPEAGKTTHYIKDKLTNEIIATTVTPTGGAGFTAPELAKAYLEINGGCLSQVYGGGNNATVTDNTVISMDNLSKGLQELIPAQGASESDADYQARLMTILRQLAAFTGLSTFQGDFSSLNYTSSRVFGGNNRATMSIHPHWNLKNGKIRDLYSGGNEGDMTNSYGLLLDIQKGSHINVLNVYGGCRKANVHPLYNNGAEVGSADVQLPVALGYHFPAGLSARVLVHGGDITNVYGGNDITGRVWGGTAVGIRTSIRGDVYGGGNGSYAYTDNPALKDDPNYRDFYYEVPAGKTPVEALNDHRPHVEQTSLRLWGESPSHRTIIGGSVYVGGNSATVIENPSLDDPIVELKIGSNVIADNVFLGNNGVQMVGASAENVLQIYKSQVRDINGVMQDYSIDFDLEDPVTVAKCMEGCAMSLHPTIVFDNSDKGDPDTYVPYSSAFGSLFCGGNVGSMTWPGTSTIDVSHSIVIFDKFVTGCNNAYMPEADGLSAEYWGGLTGTSVELQEHGMEDSEGNIKDAVIVNLSGLKIQPKRWVTKRDANYDRVLSENNKPIYISNCTEHCELPTINSVCEHDGQPYLEWNTYDVRTGKDVANPAEISGTSQNSTADDVNRRLRGGNIYGGCYAAGFVNGNVVININETIMDRDEVFANVVEDEAGEGIYYETNEYHITKMNSGVIIDEQGMDVLGKAMNVFGGGYGAGTEIWGSATINLKEGYVFQVFGGAEQGVIGRPKTVYSNGIPTYPTTDLADGSFDGDGNYAFNGYLYVPDERTSTYINLDGAHPGVSRHSTDDTSEMAETEFIYGGAFEGPIMGNTVIHLGNGRIFNSFAGSCNADIMGHTETYVGINANGVTGFPFIRDHIYGGNDLGGKILGSKDFTEHVGTTNGQDLTKVHGYDSSSSTNPDVLTASAYIEYITGRVVNIFGGAYGDYDYTDVKFRDYCNEYGQNKGNFSKPRLDNAFVNFKPVASSNASTAVSEIYGAGQGQHYVVDRDSMQNRSYILIDIPQTMTKFQNTVVFGAGAYGGLGMEIDSTSVAANPDRASAVIDLVKGQIKNVYGGSYKEGVTRRSVVNVPAGSTIAANNIFGGAYGIDSRYPCDVYESFVNYNSSDAQVAGGLYGGNNNARRTIYAHVNVNASVWSNRAVGYQATVYGAGLGENTWAEYTDVTIGDGGIVYKAFGGGNAGQVLNLKSVLEKKRLADAETDPDKKGLDIKIGGDYTNCDLHNARHLPFSELATDIEAGNTRDFYQKKERYNTNVHVLTGGNVTGYAYGGGYGETATVSGSTYIDILGGTVDKDIYGGGQGGSVRDLYSLNTFPAQTNVYVKSGTVRNAYGGGYLGSVGYHPGAITETTTSDVLGRTNVVVGALNGTSFADGIPAIQRNVYGSGEGGSLFGSSHLTINNGYVGYRYNASGSDDASTTNIDERYVEEVDDPGQGEAAATNAIVRAGNAFGGGYIANSYVDTTYVYMYGGHLRGDMFGGGEIGPVGRGTKKNWTTGAEITEPTIAMGGGTHVYLYDGHVHRDVFGGGRGYDSWGGDGTKFMTTAQINASDFFTKGFVFGSTDVNIRGGIIGTEEGVDLGYGNVFGGGDIGYVYSADGQKVGSHPENLSPSNGLPEDGGGYYYKGGTIANGMTNDCRVDVAPYCKVTDPNGIDFPEFNYDSNGHIIQAIDANGFWNNQKSGGTRHFAQGEYVPVDYLNTLRNKTADASNWSKLDLSGIHIYNAVFAGGNVSVGSDQIFVNSYTVFGNATAALRDIYHRDLITIGTEHVGGLYGDGNLTFVDGFRELVISNYGTDFYGLSDNISIEEYHSLSDRERAYFELKYECQASCTDKNGKDYDPGAQLTAEEYNELFDGTGSSAGYNNVTYWKEAGFCSIYAGRLLNTIQRADFVGVWGSRMVLQGARDRVPEKADYTNYTINRVGEISLNRITTQNSGDTTDEDKSHGNYFGIYSVVNYLGNLTSDVRFNDVRTTDVSSGSSNAADGVTTYKEWKIAHKTKNNRNNGTSKNKVALASGVYLEIINESTEKRSDGVTDWGYVTGVIELDLINVMQGLGGGYVYAKNQHGVETLHDDWDKVTLSPYNQHARTHLRFTYATATAADDIETSGNFIHNTKQIVDDCYPTINSYLPGGSPAHYWYIKGSIYVYDQYISAYTGSATAYSQNVTIPLTITAASHGKLTLRDVQPNFYAYYDKDGNKIGTGTDPYFEAGGIRYALNDPITYWDYELLSDVEKSRFVRETYTVIEKCKIGGVEYPKGYAMLPSEYETIKNFDAQIYDEESGTYKTDTDKPATFLLRLSNNVSHDTGYALTYDINNPMAWDKYYTPENGPFTISHEASGTTVYDRLNSKQYDEAGRPGGYLAGPTYRLKTDTDGVYGQREYGIGDIITKPVYDTYTAIDPTYLPANQATFEEAYVVTQELIVIGDDNSEHHIYPGVAIAKSDFDNNWDQISSKVKLANIITSTLPLDVEGNVYLYAGDLITDDELTTIKNDYSLTDAALSEYVAKAYYCSEAGKYGGDLYEVGKAYRTLDAWSGMSEEDRSNFVFDYDALDLLIDPTYGRAEYDKKQYDGVGEASPVIANDPNIYSQRTPLDYEAQYTGTSNLTYTKADGITTVTIHPNDILTREQYEAIPNERYHYSPLTVTAPGNYYVVNSMFIRGDMPYSVGETISQEVYDGLNANQKLKVDVLNFPSSKTSTPTEVGGKLVYDPITYYYCRDAYTVNENGEGVSVTTEGIGSSVATYNAGQTVPLGTVISQTSYEGLVNKTTDGTKLLFQVLGNMPTETTTLYVSRESDIFDLSKEKVITIIYLYEYEESDEAGIHITPINEQHVLNIHLQFKSGVPEIGQLQSPPTVLPSSTVGLKVPNVTPGAYEILSSGWEIFTNDQDATTHKNGQPYINNGTPMYWYQDGYWVAYYTKTYLGKTYSNSVQFSVANYHDLDKVMQDKRNHMYLDHKDAHRQRDPKIYIDNRDCTSDATKNELDLLKDFFDLTMHERTYDHDIAQTITGVPALAGHVGVDVDEIGASKNLEFILRSDMQPKAYTDWTPIGTDAKTGSTYDECFEGMLHGDGHTISGLNNSLFKSLCGEIYNLGVTGTFTGAGLVDTGTGYVENCWVHSEAPTVDNTVKAVFGNPDDTEYPTSQQVVNCYYPETNEYSETANAHGNARKMPLKAFYNGEVTYDLNGFYLNKRYFDQALSATGNKEYTYFPANADGTLPTAPVSKYYSPEYAIYPLDATTKLFGYVEYRYADGDFIYANGTIPENKDIRLYEDAILGKGYYPIWPDDYLFFGQRLTYGYEDANERYHQDWPTYVNKVSTRLTSVSADNNRVYRAPAYFQSSEMGVAHYNPYAVFAPYKSGDPTRLAYNGMTAIDFTGYNGDVTAYPAVTASDYQSGLQTRGFFPPLLDNDGLEALRNAGITRNWLVYTPEATSNAADADSKTNSVVTNYLAEPAFTESNPDYRTVAVQNTNVIFGHAVVQNGVGDYVAQNDHLLVDRQDFNAPTSYTFASNKRMWYQRRPDNYVDRAIGWEAISIPFSAELVTTQQKGEITHFYGGSEESKNDTHSKIGHEYWLREYKAGGKLDTTDPNIFIANFDYPTTQPAEYAGTAVEDKHFANSFLWDYYYQYSSTDRQDKNGDIYQQQYYDFGNTELYPAGYKSHDDYSYSEAATPYIIGFPGTTYYEFDLSGGFTAANTRQDINPLARQTVTFASRQGTTIAVSDTEMTAAAVTVNDAEGKYTFHPNYLGKDLAAGAYLLNSTGSSFEVTTAATPGVQFRPYFTTAAGGGAKEYKGAKAIAFTRAAATPGNDEEVNPDECLHGELVVYSKGSRIYVESRLTEETTIHIVNASGALMRVFTIQPGQTIETWVAPGIYIVNKKKLSVGRNA